MLAQADNYQVQEHSVDEMVRGKVADNMPPVVRLSKKGLLDHKKKHGNDNDEMVAVKNGIKRIEAHPDRDEKHLDSPQFDVYLESLPESEQDK